MQHLIVTAHPAEASFTLAVTRTYAAELEKLGHRQRTFDLYRMGFDPVLGASELTPGSAGHPVGSDVARAQEAVRAADAVTVIYPLWWLSMPAMMKGFIDRVFARGFAYDFGDGGVRGLLAGKKAVLITLSGAPLAQLNRDGGWNSVLVLQDTHVFRSTGFEVLEHLHLDEVVPQLTKAKAETYLSRVRACAQRHYAAA